MHGRRLGAALVVFSIGWGALGASGEEPLRYDRHRIVRVEVRNEAQLQALEAAGTTILNCTPGVGPLDVLVDPDQLRGVEQLGLRPLVVQDDVQGMVDRQRQGAAASVIAGADPFADYFLNYHPYDGVGGILWYMNELATRYPTLASMVNVGTTLEGRTIWAIRISGSGPATKPAVVYFGCEHAREWIAATVPPYLAAYLLQNYAIDPDITDLVDNVEFFLVPVFNVDGYVYSWTTNRFWRKNRRNIGGGVYGVDLNRNWGEGWGGQGSSGTASAETYRGTSAFSEPETQVLRDFIIAHPNLRAQLDVHSYSQLILWPYGYTSALSPDEAVYQDVGLAMKSLISGVFGVNYNAGPLYTAIYPAAGVSVDWTYVQRGMFSISYECRDTGLYGFTLPAAQIIPNNEELLPATLHMTQSDWVRSALRIEFPAGVPTTMTTGADTPIAVRIVEQTDSVEPGSARLHHRYDPSGPFLETPMASLGGEDYLAVLPATNCYSSPEFYFSAGSTGGGVVAKPRQVPTPQYYSAELFSDVTVFYQNDLDANPNWTRQGQWAFGQPTGGGGTEAGGPDPVSGHTGSYVYGYNLVGDYTDNMPEYHLTSAALSCSGRTGVHLSFWRWLGVETAAYDHAYVRVSTNGAAWNTVWRNQSEVADTGWVLQDLDISAIADNQPTVYLRWTMGSTDSAVTYCGWNIDDIRLYTTTCQAMLGDHDGNRFIGDDDYTYMETCYSGQALPFGPGCRIFDFDADGDVDCDDGAAFAEVWMEPGMPPTLSACTRLSSPIVAAEGSRYLRVTPQPGTDSVSLLVTSPSFPCWSRYADFDPDPVFAAAKIARLVELPVYRLPEEWGTIHVADRDIVPNSQYRIRVRIENGESSAPASAATLAWADILAPYGVIDALDIAGAIDQFKHLIGAPPLERCDLYPSVPDHNVDGIDLIMVVDSFKGLPYPLPTPPPCAP